MQMATILRVRQVLARLGKTRSPLYADIVNGIFTRAVKLGPRAAGWPEHEIDAIVNARIAGHSEEQLRKLVERLHEQRKSAAMPVKG